MVFVKIEISIEIHVTFHILSYEIFVNILFSVKIFKNTTINNIKIVYTTLHMKSNKNLHLPTTFMMGIFIS